MRMLVPILLAGCASEPYVELSLAHQIDSQTDYWLKTSQPWQCDNPKFSGQVGLETKDGWRVGLHHDSWVLCGTGVNNKPEVYSNEIRVTKKWGGY